MEDKDKDLFVNFICLRQKDKKSKSKVVSTPIYGPETGMATNISIMELRIFNP